MPGPQAYVAVVDPTSGIVQEYVTLVDSSGNLVYAANQAPQGRLTLTTAVPVLTAAVATAANVLYTPYSGNIVPCWNGTRFSPEVFTELTNVLADSATGNAGPAAAVAGSNYDLFVWKSGTTIYLTRGPVWTSDVARSAGTAIARVSGVLVNSVAITNGPGIGAGTYVGTVRTDAGGATVSFSPGGVAAGGTPATLNVWNMYNRVQVDCAVRDSTATWNYTSSTVRAANNNNGNRVSMVRGLDEDGVSASYSFYVNTAAALGALTLSIIGLDATNAQAATSNRGTVNAPTAAVFNGIACALYQGLPGLGFHFLQACEAGDNTNNNTINANSVWQALLVLARF